MFFNFFKRFMKTPNYQKEQYRGTIKQIMKVRGLRTISLANYNKWLNEESPNGVHSLKINLQDGYMNIYNYGTNGRCGSIIDNASEELYKSVFQQVNSILKDEPKMNTSEKRNILVKLSR